MDARSLRALIAVAAVFALAACEGSGPGAGSAPAGYGAALGSVVNPSAHKGGTIIVDDSSTPDSTDPGNTYNGPVSDLVRLYGRSLLTYRSAPGGGRARVARLGSSRASRYWSIS